MGAGIWVLVGSWPYMDWFGDLLVLLPIAALSRRFLCGALRALCERERRNLKPYNLNSLIRIPNLKNAPLISSS